MMVAWKVPHNGWLFLKPEHFNESDKAFSISKETAFKKSTQLNVLIGKQNQLR